MSKVRDYQRSKVYKSERDVFGWPDSRPPELPELSDVERFVAECLDTEWWERGMSPFGRIDVLDGRGRRRGGANWMLGYITMPRFTRHEYYVVHELAHIGVPGDDRPAHGPVWVGYYLEGIAAIIGGDEAAQLAGAMADRGVDGPLPPARYKSDNADDWMRGVVGLTDAYEERVAA